MPISLRCEDIVDIGSGHAIVRTVHGRNTARMRLTTRIIPNINLLLNWFLSADRLQPLAFVMGADAVLHSIGRLAASFGFCPELSARAFATRIFVPACVSFAVDIVLAVSHDPITDLFEHICLLHIYNSRESKARAMAHFADRDISSSSRVFWKEE